MQKNLWNLTGRAAKLSGAPRNDHPEASAIDEEAARAELRAIVEELDGIRVRLVDLHARLPVPPEETAMLAGEVEMDFATAVRSAIECILDDNLRPAIRDLAAAASNQPTRKGSE